jgi:hypothetical protein
MRTLAVVVGAVLLTACASGRAVHGASAAADAPDPVAAEFVTSLQAEFPGAELSWKGADTLVVTLPGEAAGVKLGMEDLRHKVAAEGGDAQARRAVYARYVAALRRPEAARPEAARPEAARPEAARPEASPREAVPPEAAAPTARAPVSAAPALLPQLVTTEVLRDLGREGPLASRPLAGTALHVVYMHDASGPVRYVSQGDLAALGLTAEALERRALDNLRQLPAQFFLMRTYEPRVGPVSEAAWLASRGEVVVFASQDDHDAARVLLLPGVLPEGVVVAAFAPGQHQLSLLPMLRPEHRPRLRAMAARLFESKEKRGGLPLSPELLQVSSEGVVVAP